MNSDEQKIIDLIKARLTEGREVYGPLDIETDERDMLTEAVEELLDGCIYLSAKLLNLRHIERRVKK